VLEPEAAVAGAVEAVDQLLPELEVVELVDQVDLSLLCPIS
jgi:hypothetical protein